MSQFASLFKPDGKEKTDAVKLETKSKTKPEKKKSETASLSPAPAAASKAVESIIPKAAPKTAPQKKRESGKSSNADYTQVLTYIRRDTHKEVKRALLDDLQNRNLSDLVEELLAGWLKKQKTD